MAFQLSTRLFERLSTTAMTVAFDAMFYGLQTHRGLINKTPLVLWHSATIGFTVGLSARFLIVRQTCASPGGDSRTLTRA